MWSKSRLLCAMAELHVTSVRVLQFAMLAGLGMHLLEDILAGFVSGRAAKLAANHAISGEPCEGGLAVVEAGPNAAGTRVEDQASAVKSASTTQTSGRTLRSSIAGASEARRDGLGAKAAALTDKPEPMKARSDDPLSAIVHVHTHAGFDVPHVSRAGPGDVHFIVQALLMEFGVATHSVLIGMSAAQVQAAYCSTGSFVMGDASRYMLRDYVCHLTCF
jgi:hypothetical protein